MRTSVNQWSMAPRPQCRRTSHLSALDIDSNAGTLMYRFEGDLTKLDFLRYDITNIAYAIRYQGRCAVIGVGAAAICCLPIYSGSVT